MCFQNTLRPGRRRDLVRHLRVSERWGCRELRFQSSTKRNQSVAPDRGTLRTRIKEIAAARVRYGYFRIWILLRREGGAVNPKRVCRIDREEGLSMRVKRPRRHVTAAYREGRIAPGAADESGSMDFVSDS